MLAYAKRFVAMSVMALVAVVISLPVASFAATQPVVSVLGLLTQGIRVPKRMALDAVGNVYIADQRAGGIVVLDTYGTMKALIPTAAAPNGLAFALDGTLLVSQASSVVRYNVATGQEVGRMVGGALIAPAGIAVDDVTGYIYVADGIANQVVVYTASGNYVKSFAQGVTVDANNNKVNNPLGKLSGPSGISFEKISRQLAVSDTNSHRVQFFDVDGNFIKSIGNSVTDTTSNASVTFGMMQFDAPTAVAFEYSKGTSPAVLTRIYVVDSYQGNVQVVDPVTSAALLVSGTSKNYIGAPGAFIGQLKTPSDAVFDAVNNRLMVVNGYGNITNWGIDGGKNPVDTTPPVFAIDPVIATVLVPTVSISGTVEAGSTVTVTAGSPATPGQVVYTSATAWKCDVTGLQAGSNTITVTASDAVVPAPNVALPQSVNVTYLLPAPALSVSASVPQVTNAATVELSGAVAEGAIVTVTNDSTLVSGSATVTGTNWTYQANLTEGTNSYTVVAQKPLSVNATAAVSIVMDSVAPALTVSALSDGSYTSTQVQNISGTVADAGAVAVLVNNMPATLLNNGFSVPLSLVDGANAVTVEARDLAGNVTIDKRSLTFDASSPLINITSPMDNSYTNNARLLISGNVSEAAAIVVAGLPVTVDNNSWSYGVDLAAGLNTIEVVAIDRAGNKSTLKRSVTFDAVKPVLSIASPAQDMALNRASAIVSGVVDDNNSTALVYSVNAKNTVVPVDASGNYSFKVDFVSEGVYPVVLTATDAAGNTTTATRSFIYDVTPPLLTLNAVKLQAHALGGKIGGTVDPGSVVTVKEDGKSIGVVTIDGTKWSADLSGIAYNQAKLAITATDAAGNSTVKTLKTDSNDKGK